MAEKKIVDYRLVAHPSAADFEVQVRRNVMDGWALFGGTFCDREGFYQAMVKYAE